MKKVEEVSVEKITSEELAKLTEKVTEMNKAQLQIGGIEAHKHELLHALAALNNELQVVQKELEDKYGSVSIDLATGEISHVSDN